MDASDLPDEIIVGEALERQYAFGLLIERYEAKLLRYIRRLGVFSQEDAEDLLQDVFIKAYRNLKSFDTSLSFSSWIYRIAHNETISFFRKKRVRPQGHYVTDGEEALERIKGDTDTAALAEAGLDGERLAKALDQVAQKYRDVIVLRYFEEREYKEISDILKIPSGSVATLLHRAKKALRKQLEA